MKTIRGRRALVTGAASGIGRAIALELAKERAALFLVDINGEELVAASREIAAHGGEVVTAVCDLADPAQITAAVEKLRATWGGLDILINNAGIAYYGPTHLMSDAQWRRIMAVNLMAPMQLVRELFPLLVAAEEAHILNVCSFFGLVSWRRAAVYQTTKFGLVGFTAALRAEYCRDNFGVTALCPGFVRTALLDDSAAPVRNILMDLPSWLATTPQKVAARAVRALYRNQGIVLITPAARLYWWLGRLCPGLVDWLLRRGWRRKRRMAD
jgi:3-oxoacyl-[acyl-carrier protein] reductase